MTDAWGANTFPVRKYNFWTFHLEFVDHVFSDFFDVFLKINVGGDSARTPLLEHTPASHASPSRRRVGCDTHIIPLLVRVIWIFTLLFYLDYLWNRVSLEPQRLEGTKNPMRSNTPLCSFFGIVRSPTTDYRWSMSSFLLLLW